MKEKQTKSQEESTHAGQRVDIIEWAHFNIAITVTAAAGISGD